MLSFDELLRLIEGLQRPELERWVADGWVLPVQEQDEVRFREIDVARVRLIYEIRYDLQLDEGAVPVVLSLLDQMYGLRNELRQLTEAIEAQPEGIRRAILGAVVGPGETKR